MTRYRVAASAMALSAVLWAFACDDAGTAPPPPTPPPPEPPRPATVTVTPATAELGALGATARLSAQVIDQVGQAMPGAAVTWASGDATVVTVDASGLATAVANGSATVTAMSGSASGSATVTVAQKVSAVTVSPREASLVAGDSLRLAAGAADANGHAVEEAAFEWASTDTLVARVDGEGLVIAVAAGAAEMTAASSGVAGRATLMVAAPVPTTAEVRPDSLRFAAIEENARLSVDVRDQAGRAMRDVAVSWSSGDTAVAVVDAGGVVEAMGNGTTTITAAITATAGSASGAAGSASGSAAVTVAQEAAGALALAPDAASLADVGGAARLLAPDSLLVTLLGVAVRILSDGKDANGRALGPGANVTWGSANPAVAKVDASGLVTAVGNGRTDVTATSGSTSAKLAVLVSDVSVDVDRGALALLHEATGGDAWTNSANWLTHAPLGEWHGVEVDGEGRVTALRLGANGLTGAIPSELASLANLEELLLFENGLVGAIPPELGTLADLRSISLSGNKLTGSIPSELGTLAKLEVLGLSANNLTGAIPPELGSLANLKSLYLVENGLTGAIPSELGNLANLERLHLSHNPHLYGPLPISFVELDALRVLYFEGTDVCVPADQAIRDWLEALEAYRGRRCAGDREALIALYRATGGGNWRSSVNWLTDASLAEWHGVEVDGEGRVTRLVLDDNGLTGRIPRDLGNLAELTDLSLEINNLTGAIPPELGNLTNLERLDLFSNDLTGAVPPELGRMAKLRGLWLAKNSLSGAIPPELGNLASLTALWLGGNNLTGAIPPELGKLANLRQLGVNHNNLTGAIPPELGNLANLEYLDLNSTGVTGAVPSELGNLASLEYLLLHNNPRLSGRLSRSFLGLRALRRLYLNETDVCAPADQAFQDWLKSLEYRGRTCATAAGPQPTGYARRAESDADAGRDRNNGTGDMLARVIAEEPND